MEEEVPAQVPLEEEAMVVQAPAQVLPEVAQVLPEVAPALAPVAEEEEVPAVLVCQIQGLRIATECH